MGCCKHGNTDVGCLICEEEFSAQVEAAGNEWTKSNVEEVIGALWAIASIMCFGFGFPFYGWLCATKAAFDMGASIWFGFREEVAKKRASNVK